MAVEHQRLHAVKSPSVTRASRGATDAVEWIASSVLLEGDGGTTASIADVLEHIGVIEGDRGKSATDRGRKPWSWQRQRSRLFADHDGVEQARPAPPADEGTSTPVHPRLTIRSQSTSVTPRSSSIIART